MFQEWRGQTLGSMLDYSAKVWPDRIAVLDGNRRVTYEELRRRVRVTEQQLRNMGVCPGDRVAHLLPVGLPWVEVFFAVARLGAAVVPLNLTWTARELRQGLALTDPHLLVVGHTHRGENLVSRIRDALSTPNSIDGASSAIPSLRAIATRAGDGPLIVATFSKDVRAVPGRLPRSIVDSEPPKSETNALILLTSGTSAFPKPAVHTHESVLAGVSSYADGLEVDATDTFVHTTPNYHVGGILTMCIPLLRGARTRLLDWFEPAAVLRAIREDEATLLWGFETHFSMLRQDPSYTTSSLSGVTRTMVAGSPSAAAKIATMGLAHVGSLYGSTEYMGSQSFFPYRDRFDRERMLASNGRPTTSEIRIVNPETGEQCAPGELGEIAVRGPSLFREYFRMPGESQSCMDEHGFFRSGDIGRVDTDGYLFYEGRYKEMIKSGGENVAANEVENFIQENMPDIERVVVLGTPHHKWTEAVTAVIEPARSVNIELSELSAACRGKLAGYKIPRRLVVVAPEEWVITPTGKVDRNAARAVAMSKLAQVLGDELEERTDQARQVEQA